MTIRLTVSNELEHSGNAFLDELVKDRFASRLFRQDPTLWGAAARAEASLRLGWVDPFPLSHQVLAEALQLRDDLLSRAINNIVLCGMGGSSLAPEVIARESGVPLAIVDSTHPDVVRRALECDLEHTAVVISSKSGETLETLTHSELFRCAFLEAGLNPAEHIIYVTDPGSPFAEYASEGYRVFLADPSVGGRFSALTAFGIVPTVLAGADFGAVLSSAKSASDTLRLDSPDNPALRLASALAGALPEQYVLLLTESDRDHWGLGDWIEQLIAESTGKEGKGLLPIALDSDAYEISDPPSNSLIIWLGTELREAHGVSVQASLGEQLLLWEVATAALGALLGINPFNQPDVESQKVAAHAVLNRDVDVLTHVQQFNDNELIGQLRSALPPNGYIAIQAFVDPDSSQGDSVLQLRNQLARTLGVPIALGWGPRYLHSTGQIHKGGPALGVYLQLIDESTVDLAIPGSVNGFSALLLSQANGDRAVLESRGRTVLVRRN